MPFSPRCTPFLNQPDRFSLLLIYLPSTYSSKYSSNHSLYLKYRHLASAEQSISSILGLLPICFVLLEWCWCLRARSSLSSTLYSLSYKACFVLSLGSSPWSCQPLVSLVTLYDPCPSIAHHLGNVSLAWRHYDATKVTMTATCAKRPSRSLP